MALSPALTPVRLCRDAREELDLGARSLLLGRSQNGGSEGLGQERGGRVSTRANRLPVSSRPVPTEAKPAAQKGMTLPGSFPGRTPDSPGLATAAARAI